MKVDNFEPKVKVRNFSFLYVQKQYSHTNSFLITEPPSLTVDTYDKLSKSRSETKVFNLKKKKHRNGELVRQDIIIDEVSNPFHLACLKRGEIKV